MARQSKRDYLAHQAKAIKTVASNSLANASIDGFKNLSSGNALCSNMSASKKAEELKVDLAARQIEHCLEAWNYLSQATWSLLNGQENQAIHMAYYSEVRSADSLFAATGIAEKEHPGYYINKSSSRKDIKFPTHLFIREIWPEWCKRSDAIEAYSNLKVVSSLNLADIGKALNLTSQSGSGPILSWGYELIHFSNDHKTRNEASYQASYIYNGITSSNAKGYAELVSLAWEHLLPGGISGQLQFEINYARYIVQKYCLDFATQEDSIDENLFNRKLKSVVENLNSNTGVSEEILNSIFNLTIEEDPNFELFNLASSPKIDAPNVYSRAVIMARLATSKLQQNISSTQCTNAINWISLWLQEAGAITENETPEDITSIAESFIEAATICTTYPLSNIWREISYEASVSCKVNSSLCWSLSA